MDVERGDERRVGVVDPFASFSSLLPIARLSQVIDPPGEGAALGGAGVVDGALIVPKKRAGIGARLIEKGVLPIDKTGIFLSKFLLSQPEISGKSVQILLGEVDVAGRAGATFAAAGALEPEPFRKPRFYLIHTNSSVLVFVHLWSHR